MLIADIQRSMYYGMRGKIFGYWSAAYVLCEAEDEFMGWDIRLLEIKGIIRDDIFRYDEHEREHLDGPTLRG